MQTFIDIHAALAAIEPRSAGLLHTGGRFCAFSSSSIDLGRVNIIADAMYHALYVAQLRMSVNNPATHSQKHLQLKIHLQLFGRKA